MICYECDMKFETPKEVHTTYESLYGVSRDFGSRTPCTLEVCPYCGSDDIEEEEEEEEEGDC